MVLEKGFDPERVEHSYAANEAVQYLMRVYEAAEMEVGNFHKEHEQTEEVLEKMATGGLRDDDDTRH